MMRSRLNSVRLLTLVTLLFVTLPSRAAEKSAAELLPASTGFYAEVERPKDLIALVLDHPLYQRLQQSADYQKALDNPKVQELKAVLAVLEQRSGVSGRQALENATAGGFAVAFDAETQGLVILSKSEDPKAADAVRDALFQMAREDAAGKGKPDPIQTHQYRGLTAYQAGEAYVGNLDKWTVIANKPDLAKAVANAFLDGENAGGKALAADEEFTQARGGRDAGAAAGADADASAKPTAWAFLRLSAIREHAKSNPVFDKSAKSDDGGAELFFGGLFGPLRNAPYATASLVLDRQHLKLALATPNDPSWAEASRQFFFAPADAGGGAAKPLKPRGTVLSISAYRDLGAWWAAGPDLLDEGAAAKMAQADSGLSAFLGGKSFGTDVLGSLRPQMQLVAAVQDYAGAGVKEPTIKLPAFAAVFRLKEKEAAAAKIRNHFKLAFQSIVALANLDGSQKGRPMLAMASEKRGKAEILSASYDAEEAEGAEPEKKEGEEAKEAKPDPADPKAAAADLHFNFSPALVISKDHLIFCSTKQLAEELADLAAAEGGAEATPKVPENTLVELSAQPVADLLKANRDQLVAQNMLEKGHDREAAEKEIDLFLSLVGAVKDATLKLTPTDKAMTLEVEVTTQE